MIVNVNGDSFFIEILEGSPTISHCADSSTSPANHTVFEIQCIPISSEDKEVTEVMKRLSISLNIAMIKRMMISKQKNTKLRLIVTHASSTAEDSPPTCVPLDLIFQTPQDRSVFVEKLMQAQQNKHERGANRVGSENALSTYPHQAEVQTSPYELGKGQKASCSSGPALTTTIPYTDSSYTSKDLGIRTILQVMNDLLLADKSYQPPPSPSIYSIMPSRFSSMGLALDRGDMKALFCAIPGLSEVYEQEVFTASQERAFWASVVEKYVCFRRGALDHLHMLHNNNGSKYPEGVKTEKDSQSGAGVKMEVSLGAQVLSHPPATLNKLNLQSSRVTALAFSKKETFDGVDRIHVKTTTPADSWAFLGTLYFNQIPVVNNRDVAHREEGNGKHPRVEKNNLKEKACGRCSHSPILLGRIISPAAMSSRKENST